MKQAVHDNLNPFLGMSFNEKEEMVVLWKFCSRGTLQVTQTSIIDLNNTFKLRTLSTTKMSFLIRSFTRLSFGTSLLVWNTFILQLLDTTVH